MVRCELPEEAAHIRSEEKRLDRVLLRTKERHYDIENDETRGGATGTQGNRRRQFMVTDGLQATT
jgi:hypothetical protein